MTKAIKRSNIRKRRRIIFVISCFLISISALTLIIINFKDNMIFFYSPSEFKEASLKSDKIIRVGGLVKENSIKYIKNSGLNFIITDNKEDLLIRFKGIKPDLFREGQGMIAKGIFDIENNIFIAEELLTKHDENYMPPEIKRSLK